MRNYAKLMTQFKQSKEEKAEQELSNWTEYDLKVHVRRYSKSVLHYSCCNGWKELSIRLIEEFELDPNLEDYQDNTSLHMACKSGNIELVKYLVRDKKCNPLKVNNKGHTALDIAIIAKYSKIAHYLYGCNTSFEARSRNIMKMLYCYWDEEVARSLICDGGCQVTMNNGTTLLHEFARCGKHLKKLEFLVHECHCDPLKTNDIGHTVLDCAIMAKNSMLVSYLINECGCNQLCKTMGHGKKIMKLLSLYWDEEIARCLICDGGCQVTMENGTTLLHEFSRHGNQYSFKKLIFLIAECKCDPLKTNGIGHTVLDCAIMAKNSGLVSYLIKGSGCAQLCKSMGKRMMNLVSDQFWDNKVAKCLICDGGCQLTMENGTTLLHEFARQGLIERVSFLSAVCNCDANLKNEIGNTILHEFCQSMMSRSSAKDCRSNLEQLIIKCKCDPDIENINGETVLHIVCYSLLQCGYRDDRCCAALYVLLHRCRMSPHIHLNNTEETLLHIVCKVILLGNHNPVILHYLIVECKCDPVIDKNIILRTLLHSLVMWDTSSEILYDIILEYSKNDLQHIALDNGESVCLMCYLLKCFNVNFPPLSNIKVCFVCNGDHNCNSMVASEISENDSFLVFACKLNRRAKNFLLNILCYCIASLECKCDSYKALTKYSKLLDQICLICCTLPGGLTESVCVTTMHRLIITLDCQVYLTDTVISTLFKKNVKI